MSGISLTQVFAGLMFVTLLSSDVISCAFEYQSQQNHSVFFYEEGEFYVGGSDFVLKLDADDCHVVEVSVFQSFLQTAAYSLILIKLSCGLFMGSQYVGLHGNDAAGLTDGHDRNLSQMGLVTHITDMSFKLS